MATITKELQMIDDLITHQSVTMITAALLGIRKHRIHKAVLEARDMTPRVTPEVMLWLMLYNYNRQKYTQQATKKYAMALWYKAQINLRGKSIKALLAKAENGEATQDDLQTAKQLQQEAEQLVNLLTAIDLGI